jgi:hypothetical protein
VTAIITEDAVLLAALAVIGLRAAARLLSRRLRRQQPEGGRAPVTPVPAAREGSRAYLGATRPQSQLVRPYVLRPARPAPRRPAEAEGASA